MTNPRQMAKHSTRCRRPSFTMLQTSDVISLRLTPVLHPRTNRVKFVQAWACRSGGVSAR